MMLQWYTTYVICNVWYDTLYDTIARCSMVIVCYVMLCKTCSRCPTGGACATHASCAPSDRRLAAAKWYAQFEWWELGLQRFNVIVQCSS